MIRPDRLIRLAAAGLTVLSLSACITVLPKATPAQLYRFGVESGELPAATTGPRVGVLRVGGGFQREASRDQILTIRGEQVAYIAEARWVAPAEVLFDQAVTSAFENDGGRVRLMSRGEPSASPYILRLDVRNFETHYEGDGPPVVLIRVRAVLIRSRPGAKPGSQPVEQLFESRTPASANRIGAIVAAYDQALTQVLKRVVTWTGAAAT